MQPIENAIEATAEVVGYTLQLAPASALLLTIVCVALAAVLIALIAVLVKMSGISKRLSSADPVTVIGHISAPQLPRFEGIDPAVVAAISAAVAAYAPSGKQLVVRSVRRTSAWSDAGRRESLNY